MFRRAKPLNLLFLFVFAVCSAWGVEKQKIEPRDKWASRPVSVSVGSKTYKLGMMGDKDQKYLAAMTNDGRIVRDAATLKKIFLIQYVYRLSLTDKSESLRIKQIDYEIDRIQTTLNMSYLTEAVLFIRDASSRALAEAIVAALTGGSSTGRTIAKAAAISGVKNFLKNPISYAKGINYLTIQYSLDALHRARKNIADDVRTGNFVYERAIQIHNDIVFGFSRSGTSQVLQGQLYLAQGGSGDLISQLKKVCGSMADQLVGKITESFKHKVLIDEAVLGARIADFLIRNCPAYAKYVSDTTNLEKDFQYETSQFYMQVIEPTTKHWSISADATRLSGQAKIGDESLKKSTGKLRKAGTFNSSLRFKVAVIMPDMPPREFREMFREIGSTPSQLPLDIPECRFWVVMPEFDVQKGVSRLVDEIRTNAIPGLALDEGGDVSTEIIKAISGLEGLEVLVIWDWGLITKGHIQAIAKMQSLRILVFNFVDFSDTALMLLDKLNWLEELYLRRCDITDTGLRSLENFTNLKILDLSGNDDFTDTGLKSLEKLTNLEGLYLESCDNITSTGFRSLERLKNLKWLDLSSCDGLTDSSLASLGELLNLKWLNLTNNKYLTDTGLKSLEELTNLEVLHLGDCRNINGTGFSSLERLKNIRELDLHGLTNLTDTGLKSLEDLTKLQVLNLWACVKITDTSLKSIEKLENLEVLSLRACYSVTDKGLSSLESLTSLKNVNLSDSDKITDVGIKSLEKLPNLEVLELWDCVNISDTGLKSLENLKNLIKLDLSYCNRITSEGLKSLENLKNLRQLELHHCNNLTNNALQRLKRVNPGCIIEH